MTGPRIIVDAEEVLEAVKESGRPLGETEILLNVLSNRGLRLKEEPGQNASVAIRKEFNLPSLRRALHQLERQGHIEVLTGAQWGERGRHFYDQRPNGRYWAARESKLEPVHTQVAAPKKMPSPRQLIHKLVCTPQHWACIFSIMGSATNTVGDECRQLDELLDFNDEQLLHAKARDLYARWEQMSKGRNVHGPGVTWSVREVDPFEEVDDGGVIDVLSPKSVDGYPGCPVCEKGDKHYHRKSDDSLVRVPGIEGDD